MSPPGAGGPPLDFPAMNIDEVSADLRTHRTQSGLVAGRRTLLGEAGRLHLFQGNRSGRFLSSHFQV